MINRNERILVEALRHSDRVSIRFDDITVYVRNGEFSHDVATALQTHFNRQHEREYSKPKILSDGDIMRENRCKKR